MGVLVQIVQYLINFINNVRKEGVIGHHHLILEETLWPFDQLRLGE